jgi:hypothetical protein
VNDTQQKLLSMQANLDQLVAAIDSGLADPECESMRATIEQMRELSQAMLATVNAALEERSR